MNIKKAAFTFLIISLFLGTAYATGPLKEALSDLCGELKTLVPVAAMLMVLLAAVIYASGQMMGAETRARANVWATSCLTGAIIGLLIAAIAPSILGAIANPSSPGTPISCE